MAISPGPLLTDYPAANVRLFFRVYFIVLSVIVFPLGTACSAARVRLSISKGRNVSLTKMMGWLGGVDCITTAWKLRAFPSGALLTLLMLVAYFVSIASDLAGTYIRTVEVHDQCLFGTGLVLRSNRSIELVPWNGLPYSVVTQAQITSLGNDGLQGIYNKVNYDQSFSAEQSDIVGAWQCTQNSIELDYPADEAVQDIADDLVNQGLLYNTGTTFYEWSGFIPREHVVMVDTSNNGGFGDAWDVRVVASTVATNTSINTMLSFQCTLRDDTGWVTNVLKGIETTETIPDWMQVIQGSCYSGTHTPARPDLSTVLERIFNSMVMVASGGNYLLDSSQATATQGCLTNRTWVLYEVIALAVLGAALVGFLVLYLLLLNVMSWSNANQNYLSTVNEARVNMKREMKHIPGSLTEWVVQAVQESKVGGRMSSEDAKPTKERDLKMWAFRWLDLKDRFGVVSERAGAEQATLLVNSPK